MPYVPSKKTPGHMNKYNEDDRVIIDEEVHKVAFELAECLEGANLDEVYAAFFAGFDFDLGRLSKERKADYAGPLAKAVFDVAKKYNYDGAFLGEANYAITRLIQEVPQAAVKLGKWKEELRYWVYAKTVEALIIASKEAYTSGMKGVFEDIKDEYKRRVNPSYETEQILKSGDCYDTPYYNKVVELKKKSGETVGHILVDMKRSPETVNLDKMKWFIQVEE